MTTTKTTSRFKESAQHPRRQFLWSAGVAVAAGSLGCQSVRPRSKSVAIPSSTPDAFEEDLKTLDALVLPPPPHGNAFTKRVQRARQYLEENAIDAVVITPSTNLRYFTGISWWLSERFFAWVLPREGPPFLVVPAFEGSRAAERQELAGTHARILTWREHEDPYALLAKSLRLPGNGARVVVDPASPLSFASHIRRALLNANVEPARDLVDSLRGVKSEIELACMRAANDITLTALRFVFARLRPGQLSTEIASQAKRAQVALGGSSPWALSLVGPAAAFPHGTKEAHRLKAGVGLLVDTGISVHGYQSVVMGPPTAGGAVAKAYDTFIAAHALVRQAQQLGLAAANVGARPGDVDNAARSFLGDNGYGPGDKFFTHRLGHGIGLDGHEAPYLVGGNHTPLVVGNCASCEPGVYVPHKFGIRVEDIFVATETGAKTLGPPQTGPFPADV